VKLICLIYVSSATRLLSTADLDDILAASRRNNTQLGVTGMLLYKDGNFMQALEGPEEAVLKLQRKIARDPRHKGLLVLRQVEVKERAFKEWAMGYYNLDAPAGAAPAGYSNFLRDSLLAPEFVENPSIAHKLLRSFRESMR